MTHLIRGRSWLTDRPAASSYSVSFPLYNREYERAIEELEAALLLDANFTSTIGILVRAHALLGNRETALEYVERWRQLRQDNLLAAVCGALSLKSLGLEAEAREIYAEALEVAEAVYVQPDVFGALAGAIGDFDSTFAHFEEALDEGSLIFSWLRDPLLEQLHADPCYAQLLQRVGLPP